MAKIICLRKSCVAGGKLFPKPLTRLKIYTPIGNTRRALIILAMNYEVQLNSAFDDRNVSEKAKPVQPSTDLPYALTLYEKAERLAKEYGMLSIELKTDDVSLTKEDLVRFEGLLEKFSKGESSKDEFLKAYIKLKAFCNLESELEKVACTDKVSIIDVWARTMDVDVIIDSIKSAFPGSAFEIFEKSHEDHHKEEVESKPTLLSRSRAPEVFRKLVLSFGTPKSNELEPSIFMALTYPIIFAFMFGDLGHGILLTIAGVYMFFIQRKGVKLGETLSIIVSGAKLYIILGVVSSIVGLFMYREAFGSHELAQEIYNIMGLPEVPNYISIGIVRIPIRMNPIETPLTLARMCIIIAFFQISFGIILSTVNAARARENWKIVGNIGWLAFYWAIAYLFFSNGINMINIIFNFNTILYYFLPPILILIVGRVMEGGFGQVFEALEQMISLISNTFSYFRILAIGAAHTLFSKIFFDLGASINLFIFIPLLALGTVLIMSFEGMLAFLHCLRLHWVEFFMKFYSGTGTRFKQFKLV
ncbi:MAG: V-type ATPase 116kDa subunit family protein [Nitrososphaeria archaeon]